MSIPLVVDGVTYNYPTDNEPDWGYQASQWAEAITNSSGGGGGLSGIASIAALREFVRVGQTRLLVNSFYGDDNGGGGVFFYVEPDDDHPAVDDGGITIIANDGSIWKRSDSNTVNVKWFGARGDNTGDDRPFVQAALDAAGAIAVRLGSANVYVPTGRYPLYTTTTYFLWLSARPNRNNYATVVIDSNVTLFGDGWGSEFVLMSTPPSIGTTDGRGDYSTSHMVVNRGAQGLPAVITNHNINVINMGFDGGWIHESGECVTLCAVSQFKISGCHFKNTYFECTYMVYSRNGIWTENHANKCGLPTSNPLNDGGGPMIDTCSDIMISNNVFVDIGYYAVLAIDSYNCTVQGNTVKEETYLTSAGYQAIRVQGCARLTVADNKIWRAGYNGIWINNSNDCIIKNNVTIQCGFGSGGGNQIAGIQVEADQGVRNGGHLIEGNFSALNKGSGISTVDSVSKNDITQYHSGHTISNNKCIYNYRDGISVYGNYHRLIGNNCDCNGTSVDDGVVGNGYSGISLAGASFCVVSNNTCRDFVYGTEIPFNLDAWIAPKYTLQPVGITHTSKTQNYGIYEGVGFLGEVQCIGEVIEESNYVNQFYVDEPFCGAFQWDPSFGPNPVGGYENIFFIVTDGSGYPFEILGKWVNVYKKEIPELGNAYFNIADLPYWIPLKNSFINLIPVNTTPHNIIPDQIVYLNHYGEIPEGTISVGGIRKVTSTTLVGSVTSIQIMFDGHYPQPLPGVIPGTIMISNQMTTADHNVISSNCVYDNLSFDGLGHLANGYVTSGVNSIRAINLGGF